MKTALSLIVLLGSFPIISLATTSAPEVDPAPVATATLPTTAAPTTTTGTAVHCQVPCGIYGDLMRIDMLKEDAATIRKAMTKIAEMEAGQNASMNQMVRWITTKEQHAQKIQDTMSAYWLAQRIKAPKDASDAGATRRYISQLAHTHSIIVAAMKCKQTTDTANVDKLLASATALSGAYFSKEDLEHLKEHGKEEHK